MRSGLIRSLLTILAVPTFVSAQSADSIPPLPPSGLTAVVASCSQIDLSWQPASDNSGGSGLKGYVITRFDEGSGGFELTIGAARTSFSDTNYLKSGKSQTYQVVAIDNSGNRSLSSNPVSVSTPACPVASGESVIDLAYLPPLGKSMATFGNRTVVLYIKQNAATLTWDTWLSSTDSDTGQTSRFLLHSSPGYNQVETDYLLASATELWTMSHRSSLGGNLLISQYRLNGTPPTSATLLSSRTLGDSKSVGKAMIRLRSGALLAAWNQEGWGLNAYDLTTGFAYRSPTGQWTTQYPVTLTNTGGGTILLSQWTMAQHPADSSIWAFIKRDSAHQIAALHFTESGGALLLDWTRSDYISVYTDGDHGPEGEFPFLVAVPDSSRNAILLAYQSYRDRQIFMDPLYGSGNSIFLKDAPARIAKILADSSKTYIPFPNYLERCSQFGMSVLLDGSIWLTYQPINPQTYTWNQVLASKYTDGVWGAPVFVGSNYRSYNVASGSRDPGLLVFKPDQPQVAFLTPDQRIHSFTLTQSSLPASDTTPPVSSLTSPTEGTSVSGTLTVTASASDNVGVARVDLLVNGTLKGSKNSAPYQFSWDAGANPPGQYALQSIAYDTAGNTGASAPVSVTVVGPSPDATAPVVALSSPVNGATVPRNKVVTLSAIASDNVAVTKVEFYVNATRLATVTKSPFTYNWKVPAKAGLLYSIRAVAFDAAGNSASATSTVTAK
jgi:hypothetical protein